MTLQEVLSALRNADAAGDVQAAQRLAQIAESMQQPSAMDRLRELQRSQREARFAPREEPEPETTVGGNVKEFFKGVVPGAIGLAETAGTGIAALLPEETEKAARDKIKEIAGIAKKPFEAGRGYEESVGRKLGEGLGSTLPFFALGPAGLAGRVGAAGLGVSAGAGEAREAAESKGATAEERRTATLLGAPTGLLDMLAPNIGPMKSIITTALARGGVEGATEAAQKLAQNLIAKGVYDPNQPVLAGTGEEGAYGAGVGAMASLILDLTLGRKARVRTTPGEKPDTETRTPEQQLLGYTAEPFTPVALPDGSVITSKAEYDQYIESKEGAAAQRKEDLRTSDPLAGLSEFDRNLARRGKEAALAETFQSQEPDLFGEIVPTREEATTKGVEEPTPARDERTRDMIDEMETAQIKEMEEADKSTEQNRLMEEDKAKAEKERLKFESDLAELDGRIKAKEEKTTEDKRLELLLPIVDSDVRNIPKAFVQTLKREGFANPNLTERERALINRAYDLRLAGEPAPVTPEVEPSAPAENAAMEAAVPEKEAQREPEQMGFPGMGKPKGKAPEAFSEEELAGQAEKPFTGRSDEAPRSYTSTALFPTVLTANVLDKTGLPKQSGFYKQLLGMDMSDQNQWPAITNIFGKVRSNANIKPATKQAIERIAMQAFGGMAKQQELFPKGKKGAKAEKPAKPAKEKPSEPAGRRDQDKGDDSGATGTRTVAPEPSVSKPAATERSGAAKPTEAPKPAGLGDRGQPVRDAGKREKVEPSALKEEPKAEAKKAAPKAEAPARTKETPQGRGLPISGENAYQAAKQQGETDHAIRTLAADAYLNTEEDYSVAKAQRMIKDLEDGKVPDLKFGKNNANGPGTGGKYAKEFYESLDDAEKTKFRKELQDFLYQEVKTKQYLDRYNKAQEIARTDVSGIEDADALYKDIRNVATALHPETVRLLKAGDLVGALRHVAGMGLGRASAIADKLAASLDGVKVEIVDFKSKSPSGLLKQLLEKYPDAKTSSGVFITTKGGERTILLDSNTGMDVWTLLHEATHGAVNKTLDNQSNPLTKKLTQLFEDVKGSLDTAYGATDVKEFAAEAFSNPEFQQKLASINPKGEAITAWQRFVHAVKNYLRSIIGLPTKGMDSALDSVDYMMEAIVNGHSGATTTLQSASMLNKGSAVFKALDERIINMPGMDNAFIGGIYETIREKIPTLTKTTLLRSLPLNALTEVAAKDIPMAPKLDTLEKQWGGAIDERRRAVDATMHRIHEWVKGNPEKEAKLNDIISKSTLEEVDPSKPKADYKGKQTKSNKDKQAVWEELQAQWEELGPEGQSIYKQMRDAYAESHERLLDLLFKRIDTSVTDAKDAKALKEEVYQRLAIKGRIEPYFPLMRQGDYWVTFNAKSADGQLEYYKMAFRTSVERDRAIRELKNDPNVEMQSVQKSAPTGKRDYKNAPPTSFVNNILKVLKANDVDPTVTDEIMRVFLDTLPESSFAQSFRARLGTLGFITNASQVFYSKSMSMAHQLANLEYGAKMYALRDEMQKHVEENNRTEHARLVFDTLDRQIKSMVAPDIQPWAKVATSTAFGFTLGFNVSSALVNMTQLPMVVMPWLGGKYGFTEANKALGAASRLFFGSGLKRKAKTVGGGEEVELKAGYSMDNYDFDAKDLPQDVKDLRELADLASQYGLLTRSQTSDVLESGTSDSPLAKVNAWSGFAFHHGERMNRQVSMIAAYRLELDAMRKGGKELTTEDRQAAARNAIQVTELLNGGASANSAPLLAKNSIGKLVFMYKRYGVSMYYMLFKTTRDAMMAEDPEIRAAAKRQIAGVYATSALLAGVQGVPMFGIAAALYNLILKDDDDDDFETAARKYMGEGMFNGALNYFTGTAIANRIGLTDLLLHDTGYRNQDSAVLSFLQLAGGPVYGVADRLTRGAKLIMDGETERGLEQMAPAAFGNLAKGARFMTEGANTMRGDPIIGEIGTGHSLAQMFGFAPAEYMRQLEVNASAKNIERRVLDERTKLLKKYYVATRAGDGEAAKDYMQDLIKLNSKHPGLVMPDTIMRSMQQHMRTSATMYHGVTLNKLMRNELMQHASEYDKDVTVFDDEDE